ncbi:hypothetical protein MSPP1_000595 [Malassezia sp. CBS 17886]|nr:hypothetical protein MSPP1_000595 [Malassezia sp. CBS 17886]
MEHGWHMERAAGTQDSDAAMEQGLVAFAGAAPALRARFLQGILRRCNNRELSQLEALIVPRLKVDFLARLPMEVGLHVLGFLDEPLSLTRAALVSRTWHRLVNDEHIWGGMCVMHAYNTPPKLRWMLSSLLPDAVASWPLTPPRAAPDKDAMAEDVTADADALTLPPAHITRRASFYRLIAPQQRGEAAPPRTPGDCISLRAYFRLAYLTASNWRHAGRMLTNFVSTELADADPDPNRRLALTCCALDANYIAVGMTNRSVFVFSARTGELVHALEGHESGVWCLSLVSGTMPARSGASSAPDAVGAANGMALAYRDARPSARLSVSRARDHGLSLVDVSLATEMQRRASDVACARTVGWGDADTYLVSAGSDRHLRIWNLSSGTCRHVLSGHTSTIRCVQVLEGRATAVTGSRDGTLRVWDMQTGALVHVLAGHQHSVRCLDTADHRVASGSYDFTCRIWDVDTGQCLHVLKGHHLQIYAIAFDGQYVVTGSSDSTVRVWDAATGQSLAVFQGYTHVVAQLQLHNDLLASGSGDGRVIVFSLRTFECLYRLCAHDSSVSTLQMNEQFLVTGGSDGLVKLWDARTGQFIRQLCEPCDTVWSVRFEEDKCVILCKRHGKCSVEIISFLPEG